MSRALAACALALAVGALAVGSAVAPARAQEAPTPSRPSAPLTGRAIVYLEADETVDEFVRVFVFEVIAGRLRDHGFAVSRGDGSASETPPMTCLGDAACARGLQESNTAPLVLAFALSSSGEQLTVAWRRSDAIAETPSTIVDSEGGVAATLAQELMELDRALVPCVVLVESSLAVTLSVDGAAVQSPAVVAPGEHRARAVAEEREAWSGPLQCAGGRVLRVAIR